MTADLGAGIKHLIPFIKIDSFNLAPQRNDLLEFLSDCIENMYLICPITDK